MNIKANSLKPDLTKATSKLSVTINGYVFEDDMGQLYIQADWAVEGKNVFKIRDLMNIVDIGRAQIIDANQKVDQN